MARRPNYGFQKRQKELKRQQKKDEKAERKRLRKEDAPEDTAGSASPEQAAPIEDRDAVAGG